jgi:hypothetical protein
VSHKNKIKYPLQSFFYYHTTMDGMFRLLHAAALSAPVHTASNCELVRTWIAAGNADADVAAASLFILTSRSACPTCVQAYRRLDDGTAIAMLCGAVVGNKLDIVQRCVADGVNINATYEFSTQTGPTSIPPLAYAQTPEMIELLIRSGAVPVADVLHRGKRMPLDEFNHALVGL